LTPPVSVSAQVWLPQVETAVNTTSPITKVVSVVVLFLGSGSVSTAVTLTVLVTVQTVVGITTIVLLAVAPTSSSPKSQVTVPSDWAQLACRDVTETKFTLVGSVSTMVMAVAVPGPLLVTLML
jgi:hypothetical protein